MKKKNIANNEDPDQTVLVHKLSGPSLSAYARRQGFHWRRPILYPYCSGNYEDTQERP